MFPTAENTKPSTHFTKSSNVHVTFKPGVAVGLGSRRNDKNCAVISAELPNFSTVGLVRLVEQGDANDSRKLPEIDETPKKYSIGQRTNEGSDTHLLTIVGSLERRVLWPTTDHAEYCGRRLTMQSTVADD
ncbi:hypothetical protein V1264_005959 [Littorina saxatilis]|uniref:Uncharacterized protein n=1 Tax=Littorina saxatilis TaxID=31220 RepID=A0AAN9AWF3_9CAEN